MRRMSVEEIIDACRLIFKAKYKYDCRLKDVEIAVDFVSAQNTEAMVEFMKERDFELFGNFGDRPR